MLFYYPILTAIGMLYAVEHDGKLIYLGKNKPAQDIAQTRTELIMKLETELFEYFAKDRKSFDIPIEDTGTQWQINSFRAMRNIPYGETRTYKQLALAAGNALAARAAGAACHNNQVLILTPCHRVIGASGSLTGFAIGLEAKAFLLELEKHGAI